MERQVKSIEEVLEKQNLANAVSELQIKME